jgi:protein involved in polysaccharide export with SLBB domain
MTLNFRLLKACRHGAGGLALALTLMAPPATWAQSDPAQIQAIQEAATNPGGTSTLRQPNQSSNTTRIDGRIGAGMASSLVGQTGRAKPSEFELYVRGLPGASEVRRFGFDLATGMSWQIAKSGSNLSANSGNNSGNVGANGTNGTANNLGGTGNALMGVLTDQGANGGSGGWSDPADYNPMVPADYLLRTGDELVVTLWGSVDADLRLLVDRAGRITIPRVGPVFVSGVRYADLPEVISRRVALVYKNFQVSVSLGQLRGVRVYVTGFVDRPGAVVVNSLSTLVQALLRTGGPSSSGSFRDIQLRRGNTPVVTLDLYDLLLNGNRAADQLVQADDVIHVGPIGRQVAIIGSVNRPAIFEVRQSETVEDLLRMAGGYSTVADTTRLAIERLDERATIRVMQIDQPAAGRLALASGDVLRAFNAVESMQPLLRQNTRVQVEGEVARPGVYVLPPASSVADAVRAAGGTTPGAYFYGTELMRESVRETQQRNYERALRDFEIQLTRNSSTRRTDTAEEATAAAAAAATSSRLIEQLRTLKPNGRIVLPLTPQSSALPELVLESGDRIYIPPQPTTVGVFGSVFSAGSYLHSGIRTVGDYMRLAGGPTRGADDQSTFVVRANGSVKSSLQESGYFSRGNQLAGVVADPGDTIFVPEEMNKTTFLQGAKDWTLLLYQFGIGIAGIKAALQ